MRVQTQRKCWVGALMLVPWVFLWLLGIDIFQRGVATALGFLVTLILGIGVYFFPGWDDLQRKEDDLVNRVAARMR